MNCSIRDCYSRAKYYCSCSSPNVLVCDKHCFQHLKDGMNSHHLLQSLFFPVDNQLKKLYIENLYNKSIALRAQKAELILSTSIEIRNIHQRLEQSLDRIDAIIGKTKAMLAQIIQIEQISAFNSSEVEKILSRPFNQGAQLLDSLLSFTQTEPLPTKYSQDERNHDVDVTLTCTQCGSSICVFCRAKNYFESEEFSLSKHSDIYKCNFCRNKFGRSLRIRLNSLLEELKCTYSKQGDGNNFLCAETGQKHT